VTANNSAGRCGVHQKNGQFKKIFSGTADPAFNALVLDWSKDIYSRIKNSFPTASVAMNYNFDGTAEFNKALFSNLDYDLLESGLTYYSNDGYHKANTSTNWGVINRINQVQSFGKGILLIDQIPGSGVSDFSQDDINWAISTYLLVKDSKTYLAVTPKQGYNSFYAIPDFTIPVGHATGNIEYQGDVATRTYSNGLTIVNPTLLPATINVVDGYTDSKTGSVVSGSVLIWGYTTVT
jgi:hypothetical protein